MIFNFILKKYLHCRNHGSAMDHNMRSQLANDMMIGTRARMVGMRLVYREQIVK